MDKMVNLIGVNCSTIKKKVLSEVVSAVQKSGAGYYRREMGPELVGMDGQRRSQHGTER